MRGKSSCLQGVTPPSPSTTAAAQPPQWWAGGVGPAGTCTQSALVFQVMVDEGENKLREAARNAPPGPLALRQMRALDRCDEVRTPSTGSDRDYEELQDEMDRLEQSIEESEWTRQTTSISLFDENKLFKEIDKQRQKMAGLRRYVTFLESMSGSYVLFSTVPTITCRISCV